MTDIHTYSYDDPEAKEGDVVCYSQPVALVTLPEEGGQVSIQLGVMISGCLLCLIPPYSAFFETPLN